MARNSLYPGFIKVLYTGGGHPHKMILPVIPDLLLGVWYVLDKTDTASATWTDAIDALAALIKPFLNNTDEIGSAELWTLASEDADPEFQEDHAMALAGTSATAALAYGQTVTGFRTSEGGLFKLYIMEGAGTSYNLRSFPPYAPGSIKNLTDYMIGNSGFVRGRDGGKLTSITATTGKMNDALRKKYLLGA